MMNLSAAVARILTVALLMGFVGAGLAQQAYPSKPIRLITPYAPGGSTTNVARLIGQKLIEIWGQQVMVENRPGGSTLIGSEALVKSPPDGYTIMLASVDHTIIPQLIPTPYDPIKDFAPIATLSVSQLMLAVHPSLPANNLQQFVALAKARPGQLNYATAGSGTISHLTSEMFNGMAGVKIQHIPYKGGGPAIIDLIGGQVQLTFNVPITLIPLVKSGKLKAIAVTGERRLTALPEVPTFTEAGLPGLDVKFWLGTFAPGATPKDIIGKLSAEITKILAMADIKEKLLSQGMDPLISTPDQFAALIRTEMAKYAKVIKAANIKIEN